MEPAADDRKKRKAPPGGASGSGGRLGVSLADQARSAIVPGVRLLAEALDKETGRSGLTV